MNSNDRLKESIVLYYTATDNKIKNRTFRTINSTLNKYICISCAKYGITNIEDSKQDIMIHLLTKTLPKVYMNQSIIINSNNFIFTSIQNYIKSYILPQNIVFSNSIEDIEDTTLSYVDVEDIRIQIMNGIDGKIKQQKIINKNNTIFLLILKDYIINNDYDVREFKQYVMQKMNLKQSDYYTITHRLKIRSNLFSESILDGD